MSRIEGVCVIMWLFYRNDFFVKNKKCIEVYPYCNDGVNDIQKKVSNEKYEYSIIAD